MKYKVEIAKPQSLEIFEKNRDNTASICIRSKKGEKLPHCEVRLYLSKNAALGLGKELIRYACEKEKAINPWHFYHAQPDSDITQTLGILLAPDSVEPILGYYEKGRIDNYAQKKLDGK